jgi:hypothetical protein
MKMNLVAKQCVLPFAFVPFHSSDKTFVRTTRATDGRYHLNRLPAPEPG